jgi:hypothetical protein
MQNTIVPALTRAGSTWGAFVSIFNPYLRALTAVGKTWAKVFCPSGDWKDEEGMIQVYENQ